MTLQHSLGNYLNFLNSIRQEQVSSETAHKIYAKLHLAFIHIHPFSDGNGRMVRLIANIPLLRFGLPPLLIDQQHRRQYINLLADYQAQITAPSKPSDLDAIFQEQKFVQEPFIRFCKSNYVANSLLVSN